MLLCSNLGDATSSLHICRPVDSHSQEHDMNEPRLERYEPMMILGKFWKHLETSYSWARRARLFVWERWKLTVKKSSQLLWKISNVAEAKWLYSGIPKLFLHFSETEERMHCSHLSLVRCRDIYHLLLSQIFVNNMMILEESYEKKIRTWV